MCIVYPTDETIRCEYTIIYIILTISFYFLSINRVYYRRLKTNNGDEVKHAGRERGGGGGGGGGGIYYVTIYAPRCYLSF